MTMHRLFLALFSTVVLVAAIPVAAEAPQAFLEGVLHRASVGPPWPPEQIYTPRLAGLLRHMFEVARRRTEIPCIDGDPLLDCQECSPLRILRMTVDSRTHGRADAFAQLNVAGYSRQQRYSLELTDRGWRIDDIGSKSMPSLRAHLAGCQ
jgi:hypothetical protein